MIGFLNLSNVVLLPLEHQRRERERDLKSQIFLFERRKERFFFLKAIDSIPSLSLAFTRTHTLAHTHTHTHTHAHTRTHTHTHTHTLMQTITDRDIHTHSHAHTHGERRIILQYTFRGSV